MPPARLLIIEDEIALLELLRRYLVRIGFDVTSTPDPAQGMGYLAQNPEAFQLVVLDLNLPGVSGEQLLERILADYERIRVLVSSGFPFSREKLPVHLHPRVGFLQKPYTPKMLGEAVQSLLAQ